MSGVTIVAEAAQGFEGKPVQARLLVAAAAAAGADFVKFQLVYADELAVPAYQYFELFKTLEMPDEAWRDVAADAGARGVGLAFDVYGPKSLALAVEIGATAIKLHSTDFFNASLVDAVLATNLDVWFSIGGITIDEVADWLARHAERRPGQVTLLYGFQAEPTAAADNHLRRLDTLRRTFPSLQLGFMDHAEGTVDEAGWLGALALPFGVRVIEKHLTLGRALNLEDAVSALDAADFATYVNRIRVAESALGGDAMAATDLERRYRNRALKAVVAARTLAAGTRLAESDLALKRTALAADASPLHQLIDVTGRTLARSVAAGEAILAGDLS